MCRLCLMKPLFAGDNDEYPFVWIARLMKTLRADYRTFIIAHKRWISVSNRHERFFNRNRCWSTGQKCLQNPVLWQRPQVFNLLSLKSPIQFKLCLSDFFFHCLQAIYVILTMNLMFFMLLIRWWCAVKIANQIDDDTSKGGNNKTFQYRLFWTFMYR
jgi:hypothetical protein